MRAVGIETEYGLNCSGFNKPIDFAYEASNIVRMANLSPIFRGWDYSRETPRRDLRDAQEHQLKIDPRDLSASNEHSSQMSRFEIICDTVLPNGARFYNDHNHPEYCTDVCTSLRDLIAQDVAGESLLLDCQSARNASGLPGKIDIVKNNIDYNGRSYGTHENYLVKRDIEFQDLVNELVPFFVVRQLICGAGKAGWDNATADGQRFQISQRADFIEQVIGIDTTTNRPIFNTRDEPHANHRNWRRLHVIVGDANRSEYASALKVGMTALVLDSIESGHRFNIQLDDPVTAIKSISRDPTLQTKIGLSNGEMASPFDILQQYLDTVSSVAKQGDEYLWIVQQWTELLHLLRTDLLSAADRIDWIAKLSLLQQLEVKSKLDNNALKRFDLSYHLLEPKLSSYSALIKSGAMRKLIKQEDAKNALTHPPKGTRAEARSLLVRKFGHQLETLNWSSATLRTGKDSVTVHMDEVTGNNVNDLIAQLRNTTDGKDLIHNATRKDAG